MDSYERRYHRQLHDIGVATALAQHDPKGLDKLAPPPSRRNGETREKWWSS